MPASEHRTSPSDGRRAGGEETKRVLVPVQILETEEDPGATPRLVAGLEVVLFGYHYVPLQAVPAIAREEHEAEAQRRLDELAEAYREVGARVSQRLAFVHDPERAIARAADHDTSGAVLLARPTATVDEVLVPVPGEAHLPRLLDIVAGVLEGGPHATLIHFVQDERGLGEAELLVEGAKEKLGERGIPEDVLTAEAKVAEDRLAAIAKEAEGYDGLVLGEFERSLRDALFGEVHTRIAGSYAGPILLVRRAVEDEGPEIPEEV